MIEGCASFRLNPVDPFPARRQKGDGFSSLDCRNLKIFGGTCDGPKRNFQSVVT